MTNVPVLFKYNKTLSQSLLIFLLWFFLLLFSLYNLPIILWMEKNISLVSEYKSFHFYFEFRILTSAAAQEAPRTPL